MLFDAENTILDGPATLDRALGQIRFEDVHFAYPDGHVALEDFDLRSSPASASPSSAAPAPASRPSSTCCRGSTTRPGDASCIDGHDIRSLTLASLRDQIAVVSQESVLLSATVAQNIGFGRRSATRPEIEAAARAAAADGFIRALPQGYDTPVVPTAGSSPAASASASRSPAPSCATPRSSSSTSRPPRSTPRARR